MSLTSTKTKTYIETCVALREKRPTNAKERELHFRTDHAPCDDNAYMAIADVAKDDRWRRIATRKYDGWMGQHTGTCKCGRTYRIFVPKAVMVEALLSGVSQ